MLASLFFVSAHKDSATRHGCALRSACRGVSERQWRSAAPVSAPASVGAGRSPPGSSTRGGRRDKSFCPIASLSHPFSPVLNRSHPLQHPKRTRFRLFLAESGAFFSFPLFSGCKIFGLLFVHPAI